MTIRGQLLRELYRHLRHQRVNFVCEADQPTQKLGNQNEALIVAIEISRHEDDATNP